MQTMKFTGPTGNEIVGAFLENFAVDDAGSTNDQFDYVSERGFDVRGHVYSGNIFDSNARIFNLMQYDLDDYFTDDVLTIDPEAGDMLVAYIAGKDPINPFTLPTQVIEGQIIIDLE